MTRDISGMKFNSLTAIKPSDKQTRSHDKYWEFQCDCGKVITAFRGSVTSANTKSCGCLNVEKAREKGKMNFKHGTKPARLYHIWNNMRQRCANPSHQAYKNYGMRGIKVCKEWEDDFGIFREWAFENGYYETLTIDRIDTNGNYCPDNCRWIDMEAQMQNQRKTIKIDGVSLRKWCRDNGVNYTNVTACKYRHPEKDIGDIINRYWTDKSETR